MTEQNLTSSEKWYDERDERKKIAEFLIAQTMFEVDNLRSKVVPLSELAADKGKDRNNRILFPLGNNTRRATIQQKLIADVSERNAPSLEALTYVSGLYTATVAETSWFQIVSKVRNKKATKEQTESFNHLVELLKGTYYGKHDPEDEAVSYMNRGIGTAVYTYRVIALITELLAKNAPQSEIIKSSSNFQLAARLGSHKPDILFKLEKLENDYPKFVDSETFYREDLPDGQWTVNLDEYKWQKYLLEGLPPHYFIGKGRCPAIKPINPHLSLEQNLTTIVQPNTGMKYLQEYYLANIEDLRTNFDWEHALETIPLTPSQEPFWRRFWEHIKY